MRIGERSVQELDFAEAVNLIRVVEGSSLTLTVRRSDGEIVEMQVIRRRIRG